jgi:hypothetical protein
LAHIAIFADDIGRLISIPESGLKGKGQPNGKIYPMMIILATISDGKASGLERQTRGDHDIRRPF